MHKYIRLFIGINLYAVSINFLQSLDLGMGSFDSITLQIQQIFNINQFGNASFAIHFVFFLILLLVAKSYNLKYKMIFLSILSIFILTRFVNLYSIFNFTFSPNLFNSIWIIMLLNLGLYLIASTNIIIAPFDKFVVETSKIRKIKLGTSRFVLDILLLVLVIIINVFLTNPIPITMFTFIITFATGLNMGLYQYIEEKFFDKTVVDLNITPVNE